MAVLVLNANRLVATDRLIELIWGDEPPAHVLHTLHAHLSQLRKALRARRSSAQIVTQKGGYRLEVQSGEVDISVFERLVAAGQEALSHGQTQAALEALGGALGLWRGPVLAEFGPDSFAMRERAHLDEVRLTALETKFEAELVLGHASAAVIELQTLAAEHPLRQRLQSQLMLALYRSGRQAEASDVFQRLRTRLRDELGMEPGPEIQALLRQILTHDGALQTTKPVARPGNLPLQLTAFIGREPAVIKVRRLLTDNRLVTLLGVGGVGKTRLALEVASQIAAAQEQVSAWFVDLSPVFEPRLVPDAIAAALGIPVHASTPVRLTLVERLSIRPEFIVMDNCEHLAVACADIVAELLQHTRETRVLATSRQPLEVAGEVTWPVPPLTLPAPIGAGPVEQALESESVQLFEARAKAVDTDFRVDHENAEAVISVCRRLNGVPLAIELAAALVRGMSPAEIDDHLGDRFALLNEPVVGASHKQRALGATLDWSHQLLTEPQRKVFRRLAIFAGSFELAAAEAVCADGLSEGSEIANVLLQLVDRSLVVRDGRRGNRTRYRLLETVRAYARRKLHESGEARLMAARHAEHHRHRAESAWRAYPNTLRQHADLNADIDDVRAALEWCCSDAPEVGLQIVGALGFFFLSLGYHREGIEWLDKLRRAGRGTEHMPARTMIVEARLREAQGDNEKALAVVEVALAESRREEERSIEAEAQLEMGGIEINLGRYRQAGARLRQSLALFKQLGERRHVGRVLNEIGLMAWHRGQLRSAERSFEACLAAADTEWEVATMVIPIANLGAVAFELGQLDRAKSLTEQSLGLARQHAMRPTVVACLETLGDIQLRSSDATGAEQSYRESLDLATGLGLDDLVLENIEGLAVVAHVQGSPSKAVRLIAAAAESRRRQHLPRKAWRRRFLESVASEAKQAVGNSAESDWRFGTALDLPAAVRYALEVQVAPTATRSEPLTLNT